MKKIIIVTVSLIEIAICVLLYLINIRSDRYTHEIDKFYWKYDGSELVYLDTSYDEDARHLYSDSFKLDKGFYIVTVDYDTNLDPDATYGTEAKLKCRKDNIEVNPMEGYVLLGSNSKQTSFEVYVPYNDCESDLHIYLWDNGAFPNYANDLKYILINGATIEKDNSHTARNITARGIVLFIILDAALLFVFWELSYGKGKKTSWYYIK